MDRAAEAYPSLNKLPLSKALLSDTHGQLAVHEVQLVSHDTVPEYVSV
jgi:hypothetical protein